jgi:hypothetical protein
MKDRATRHGADADSSKLGVGGLDFMLKDEGIREQIIAYIPALMEATEKKHLVAGKITFDIPVNMKDNSVEFWKAYFNAKEHKNEKEIERVHEYVEDVNVQNWETFEKVVDDFVSEQLSLVFLTKGSGSEDKVGIGIRNISSTNEFPRHI